MFRGLTLPSLGRRIFCFKTRGSRRHYSIHEHLVCSRSRFFKDRIQKNRKPIEGECSICHEDLDPKEDDVTFCRGTCGQNFHEHCIEEWTRTHMTCPMYRRNWQQPSGEPDTLDEALDSGGVQLYLDWLYIDRLQLPMQVRRHAEEYTMFMYKAWAVSDAVRMLISGMPSSQRSCPRDPCSTPPVSCNTSLWNSLRPP